MTIAPGTGYELPSSIVVTGATSAYDDSTGVVSLSEPTGNVTITATCTAISYTITATVGHGTYSGDENISYGGTATVTIAASDGYVLPSTVTVTGATSEYDDSTGVISLSSPTGNVTISAECTASTPAENAEQG